MRASSELQKNILTEIKSMFEQPRMQSFVIKYFNVQSVLHTVNHPNSKIQLQNISCLNFNVMVP